MPGLLSVAGYLHTDSAKRILDSKQRYRVMNTAGETMGYVRATNEGEAYRLAELKFGAGGLKVRMV